jgi:hypothetical protein
VLGDPATYALGARLGVRIGPLVLYGGVDPFQGTIASRFAEEMRNVRNEIF